MGFLFTLFYLFSTFVTPAEVMPALLEYRVMLVLLLATLFVSSFTMLTKRFSFKSPQLALLFLLVGDIAATILYADRWFGGALDGVLDLLFLTGIVFMVCWNVISVRRLRILTYVLAAVGIVVTTQCLLASFTGYRAEEFVLLQHDTDRFGQAISFARIRGLGVLNDPNDFAQFLLVVIAMLGCCWRPGKRVFNLTTVLLPSLVLLIGIALTRSRGAILGFTVLASLWLLRRLGKFGIVVACGAGLIAVVGMTYFTGRDLSMSEGSAAGRLDAWYAGIQMLKGSPFFGVGYQRFLEHNPLTAHNSYMLCLAELGIPGFCLWLGMLVASMMQMRAIYRSSVATDELKTSARSVFTAFVMFCVTGWFLSRSYTTVLFVLIGAAVAVQEMALKAGVMESLPRAKVSWKLATALTAFVFVASVYVILRIRGLAA